MDRKKTKEYVKECPFNPYEHKDYFVKEMLSYHPGTLSIGWGSHCVLAVQDYFFRYIIINWRCTQRICNALFQFVDEYDFFNTSDYDVISKVYLGLMDYIKNNEQNTSEDVRAHIFEELEKWYEAKISPDNLEKVTPFSDYIVVEDNDEALKIFHRLIDGKVGKAVAQVIQSAIEAKIINKPTYRAVANEFGNIGNKSGFNKYMNFKFTEEEKAPVKQQLETLL